MFSPSNAFQCRWRVSRWQLMAYGVLQALAIFSLCWLDLPVVVRVCAFLLCAAHALWALPQRLLLTSATAYSGLRRDKAGWALWSQAHGWQLIQLLPSSVVLAPVVVLHFRVGASRLAQSVCIAADAMDADAHRRLRVQLKFSVQRWVAAK